MPEIRCPLNESSVISPLRPAIVSADGIITYRELEQCVCTTLALLRRAGCKEKDCIAARFLNDWRYPVFFMAAIRMGVIILPIEENINDTQLINELKRLNCDKYLYYKEEENLNLPNDIKSLAIESLVGFSSYISCPIAYKPMLSLNNIVLIDHNYNKSYSLKDYYYSAREANLKQKTTSGDICFLSFKPYRKEILHVIFRALIGGAVLVINDLKNNYNEFLKKYSAANLFFDKESFELFLAEDIEENIINNIKPIILIDSEIDDNLIKKALEKGVITRAFYEL